MEYKTYWAVQHAIPLVSTFLDMALQRTGVQRLQQFETAEKICRDRHDCAPVVKLAAILGEKLVIEAKSRKTTTKGDIRSERKRQ